MKKSIVSSILYLVLSYFLSMGVTSHYIDSQCLLQANEEQSTDTRAFYALSSLRYYLTSDSPLNKGSNDTIAFSKDDVNSLWQTILSNGQVDPDLVEAFYSADESTYNRERVRNIVSRAWKKAQRKILYFSVMKTPRKVVEGAPFYPKKSIMKAIAPYLLPEDHPISHRLETLFSNPRVTKSEKTFMHAGFEIFCKRPISLISIARHAALPGYIFKVYLQSENREKNRIPSWEWLVKRCEGASLIRQIIDTHKLQYFTVPAKWLYVLPHSFGPEKKKALLRHPVLLVAEDMNLVSAKESARAWREKITKRHLDELYCILSHGLPSCFLVDNIPYTKDGLFACIDTEHPRRTLDYAGVKRFISPELARYWDELVKKGGNIH